MYTYKKSAQEKNTLEFLVIIEKKQLDEEYTNAFNTLRKQLAVDGFRKGKVPLTIAKKKITDDTVYKEVIRSVLPKIYSEIVSKEGLNPIYNPKIELIKAKAGEDWQIKFTVALRPIVKIDNYQAIIKRVVDQYKKVDIWLPGQANKTVDDKKKAEIDQKKLNDILTILLKDINCDISEFVIEEELNHRLTQLLEDIHKLGLTVDQYLQSKRITLESLKDKYRQEIRDTFKLEFILQAIADKEEIKVDQSDLDKILSSVTDEKDKQTVRNNLYTYAGILRKQKTIEFLLNL